MIAVIDYGVGNLFSLCASLGHIGADYTVTKNTYEIEKADKIILPGVGAFGDAIQKLTESGTKETVLKCVKSGTPILGICLGMQLLFEKSFEYGEHTGLSLLKGEIAPLAPDLKSGLKVPHMGWNSLTITKENCPILKYIKQGEYVYYVHSFYAKNCSDSLCAYSDYSIPVTGAVWKDNVFGTQFHPEKSGDTGLKMLKAFNEI